MSRVKIVRDVEHYSVGGIELIDILQAKFSFEQFEGFLVGNTIKYLLRYQYKHETEMLSDLFKAQTYIGWLVDLYSERPQSNIRGPHRG